MRTTTTTTTFSSTGQKASLCVSCFSSLQGKKKKTKKEVRLRISFTFVRVFVQRHSLFLSRFLSLSLSLWNIGTDFCCLSSSYSLSLFHQEVSKNTRSILFSLIFSLSLVRAASKSSGTNTNNHTNNNNNNNENNNRKRKEPIGFDRPQRTISSSNNRNRTRRIGRNTGITGRTVPQRTM